MLNLKAYRLDRGMTQRQVAAKVRELAIARGDVEPGLCPIAVCRHENERKRPSLYYETLYCEVYGATRAELGFRLALPREDGHPDEVDRRGFLVGAAGFMVTAALPTPIRLGSSDIVSLRDSIAHLYELDDLHGAGSVYSATGRTFQRLRTFVEYASYSAKTGQALQELTGMAAEHAGWLAFDAGQHENAQRWWLEALKWGQLAGSDSVTAITMAAMAWEASDQGRSREAIQIATAVQSAARPAPPRLSCMLLAREATGHAGQGDTTSALAALRRAREFMDQAHDNDPSWISFYGPANFASNECRVALILGDTAAAEDAARIALALNDPAAYPRNRALYLIRLAEILVQRREMDEAAAVAQQATVATADLDSARVTHALHAVTQSLAA